jgi:hypothetical protein
LTTKVGGGTAGVKGLFNGAYGLGDDGCHEGNVLLHATAAADEALSVPTRTFDGVAELPDLRDSIRDEHIPADCVLLRGGPDSTAKLRRHIERMHRAFVFDGDPVLGVSMFAALDLVGIDSRDGILSLRLSTYRLVHFVSAGSITAIGLAVVPTFHRPHVTVLLRSTDDVAALLDVLGPPQVNDKYGETNRRRWTDARRRHRR